MQDFKRIETGVLLIMIAAHSSYFGILTVGEENDCNTTVCQLKAEIKLRKEVEEKLLLAAPLFVVCLPA